MMKHNYLINLAVGTVLVVPAVTLQSGTSDSLADALEKTVQALEAVAGVEQRVQAGAESAVTEILRFTEGPIHQADDPGAADRTLQVLREEVARLQVRLDDARRAETLAPMPALDELVIDEPDVQLPVGTTGLDAGMRNLLSRPPDRAPKQKPVVVENPVAQERDDSSQAATLEPDGYTADATRLGRALYQKGRYQEALDVLSQAPGVQEARYWKARCLEKLDRFGEALDEFGRVAASEEGGHFVDRAREDIDFLRWRMAFEGRTKGSK